jgi:HTH-type transcriptional regulator / antitoxin HipB
MDGIGDKLRTMRRAQGLKLKQLSWRSGLELRHISRMERGDLIPTIRTLEKIAEGLNMKLVVDFEEKS